MSCHIVSDRHISAIIGWACRNHLTICGAVGYLYEPGREQEACDLLYAANVKSVNARYKEDNPDTGCIYTLDAPRLTPVEVMKACDGLAYQCDNWDGWDGSSAKILLDRIKQWAISELPGYDAAEWSIE